MDAHGLPLRAMITEGTVADCTKAIDLISGFSANHLLANRAYDTREIIEYAENNGIGIVIPQKESPQSARLRLGFIQLTLSYEVQHLALEKSSASLNTC